MDKNKNIEHLLRDKFESHELPVRKELWEAVSSQIPTVGSGAIGATVSSLTKWILGGAAAVVITAAIVFISSEKNKTQNALPPAQEETNTSIKTPAIDTAVAIMEGVVSPTKTIQPTKNSPEKKENSSAFDLRSEQSSALITEVITPDFSQKNKPENTSSAAENSHSDMVSPSSTSEDKAQIEIMTRQLDEEAMRYLFFSSASEAESYSWYIDGELQSNESNFSYAFNEGKHSVDLVVIDKNNKSYTSRKEIDAFSPLKYNFPNVFSPGKDNMNDVFDAEKCIENEKVILQILISDKNGKTVYQSNARFFWDGNNLSGEPVPQGQYTFTIQLLDKRNSPHTKGGIIQLFRE